MHRLCRPVYLSLLALLASTALGAEWSDFRGPHGLGVSAEKDLPVHWSADKNIVWRTKLPGPGASSPVTAGERIFLTSYTGYGLDDKKPGEMKDLRRHVLCLDRKTGKIVWTKEFRPELPEHLYAGEGSYHGYSASTPATDGERLYVFFGRSGVYCFDLDGKEIWHASVGQGTDRWGSAASPVLYKDLLIVNASVESHQLVAFDKKDGKEKWKAGGIKQRLEHAAAGQAAIRRHGTGRQHREVGARHEPRNGKGALARRRHPPLRLPQRRRSRRCGVRHRRRATPRWR